MVAPAAPATPTRAYSGPSSSHSPAAISAQDGTRLATALAILGDYVPMGVGQALGRMGGGNSLDNTLRVARLVPTHWVLLDIQVHAVDRAYRTDR